MAAFANGQHRPKNACCHQGPGHGGVPPFLNLLVGAVILPGDQSGLMIIYLANELRPLPGLMGNLIQSVLAEVKSRICCKLGL